MNLCDTILEHQKRGIKYMSALADTPPDHPKRRIFRDTKPEHTELALPSAYTQKALQGANLESLGALELELRRGMCNDALESTRQLLSAKAFAIHYKEHHVRGEVPTTRAESTICEHSVKIDKAQWRYNNSRNTLLQLGPSEKDMDQYLELTNKDLTPLKSWLDETQGVGQGYMLLSWIWRISDVPITNDWQVNALRTEWFRSRGRYKRWEEQLVLLKREMVMTMRTFRKCEDIWHWKSETGTHSPGMVSFALKQSRFHGKLASQMLRACSRHINDDIVILQWADDWMKANVHGEEFVSSLAM